MSPSRSLTFAVRMVTLLVLSLSLVLPQAARAAAPDNPADVAFAWSATLGAAPPPGFANATGIDVGPDGNVYISDATRNDIQVFTPTGAFVRKFGAAGSGAGEFRDAADVAAVGGKVYVADQNNARIQVLTPEGALLALVDGRLPVSGLANPRLTWRVDADAAGRIFLFNYDDTHLYRYSAGGALERRYDVDCRIGEHQDLAALSSGVAFCSSMSGGVWRLPLTGPAVQIGGGFTGQPSELGVITQLTSAPDNTIWAYRNESDTSASPQNQFIHLAADGAVLGRFAVPGDMLDIAASANRIFALTDARRVRVYDWSGQAVGEWGADTFAGAQMYEKPDRLAAAPDGTFYVLESGRKRLRHLSASGEVLAVLTPNPRQGNLGMPVDLAVDGLNRVYVLDRDPASAVNARIVRYANDRFDTVLSLEQAYPGIHTPSSLAITGDTILVMGWDVIFRMDLSGHRIGRSRTWDSDFSHFLDAALAPGYRVYRLYSGTAAVFGFDFGGNRLVYWGSNMGNGSEPLHPGLFVYPTDIAADLRGRIFVVDTEQPPYLEEAVRSSRAQVFDENGAFLGSFGSYGSEPGAFINAQSIAALSDGRIVVADTGNNRLQVFSPTGALPPRQELPGPAQYGPTGGFRPAPWQDVGPQGVSKIKAIAIPAQPSVTTPMIGAYGGGLARSIDGVTWERHADAWPGGDLLYAGSKTLLAGDLEKDGAYRSDDLGKTWVRLGDAPVSPRALAVSPRYDTDRTLYVGTRDNGLWRSTDGGDTWQPRGAPTRTYYKIAVLPGANGARILLADGCCAPSGLLRSTDEGETWQLIRPGTFWDFAVSPAYEQDQTVFAAPLNEPGALRSSDGGVTWASVGAATGRSRRNITLSPNYAADKTLVLWDYDGSVISKDNGESWAQLTPNDQPSILWIAFSPNYATDHAIWRQRFQGAGGPEVTTDDGASWRPLAAAPGATVLTLASPAAPDQPMWAATGDGIVSLPMNGGQAAFLRAFTWSRGSSHINLAMSPDFPTDGTAIAEAAITKDGGATWQLLPFADQLDNAAAAYLSSQAAVFSRSYATDGIALVAFDDWEWPLNFVSEARRTADRGATWQSSMIPIAAVRTLAFEAAPQSPRLYAGGEGGVAASDDFGATWRTLDGSVAHLSVRSLVTRRENGAAVVYAATSSAGMWRSVDRGETWTPFNAGLGDGYLGAAAGNDELFAAATRGGAVYLLNETGTWERVGARLPGPVNDVFVQGTMTHGRITVGTATGAWTVTLPLGEPRKLWLPVIRR